MRYGFKKGDIIKYANDPYYIKLGEKPPYYHYLILNNKKWYIYDTLCLDTGEVNVLNKGDARAWAVKVA
jgi:signal peptidase I